MCNLFFCAGENAIVGSTIWKKEVRQMYPRLYGESNSRAGQNPDGYL